MDFDTVVSTEAARATDSGEWQRHIGALYEMAAADPAADAGGIVSSRGFAIPKAYLHNATFGSLVLTRDGRVIETRPFDRVAFVCCRSGSLVGEFDAGRAELDPGDLLFFDLARPVRLSIGPGICDVLVLDRSLTGPTFRGGALHGVRLGAASALATYLGRQVQGLFEIMERGSVAQIEAVLRAFVSVAADAWTETAAPDRTELAANRLLQRAMEVIGEELGTPALTPALICARLGVSRNLLYRLFKPHGGVSAYIVAARLEAALKALINAAPAAGIVTRIAARFCFRSHTHFSRVFRERFGRAPRAMLGTRRQILAGHRTLDWVRSLAHDGGFASVEQWLDH